MALSPQEIKNQLSNFTGTQNWHKFNGGLLLTDGIKHLAEICQCYWLLDIISSVQTLPAIKPESFQVYTLNKTGENSAKLFASDGDENLLYQQEIPSTDFPLESISIWLVDGVILLPTEY